MIRATIKNNTFTPKPETPKKNKILYFPLVAIVADKEGYLYCNIIFSGRSTPSKQYPVKLEFTSASEILLCNDISNATLHTVPQILPQHIPLLVKDKSFIEESL